VRGALDQPVSLVLKGGLTSHSTIVEVHAHRGRVRAHKCKWLPVARLCPKSSRSAIQALSFEVKMNLGLRGKRQGARLWRLRFSARFASFLKGMKTFCMMTVPLAAKRSLCRFNRHSHCKHALLSTQSYHRIQNANQSVHRAYIGNPAR